MISQSDLIMVVLAFLIGYVDDVTGPQVHHYNHTFVLVDSKYQCPSYCGIDHHHHVHHDPSTLISSDAYYVPETLLGPRISEKKYQKLMTGK